MIPSMAVPAWSARLKVITSRCEGCHRSLALRRLSARKAGVRLHDRWYCGSACFLKAAEARLTSLMFSGVETPSHLSRMPLGLILVDRGWLNATQLRAATDEQKEFGEEIGELLVRRGFVNESQVTAGRATQWGCPVYTTPNHLAPVTVQIPLALIRMHAAIPLHLVVTKKVLLMGFVQGIDYGFLRTIEEMTGCETKSCFITPGDFRFQMLQRELAHEQQGDPITNEIEIDTPQSPGEMASLLCGYAIDLGADEVVIEGCRDHVWAQLRAGSNEVDILFRTR